LLAVTQEQEHITSYASNNVNCHTFTLVGLQDSTTMYQQLTYHNLMIPLTNPDISVELFTDNFDSDRTCMFCAHSTKSTLTATTSNFINWPVRDMNTFIIGKFNDQISEFPFIHYIFHELPQGTNSTNKLEGSRMLY